MEEFIAKIIKDGRITVPKEIRELLKLKLGDYVRVKLEKVEK